jgi:protein-disulfide isomerase
VPRAATVLAAGLLVLASSAFAQTGDGKSPAKKSAVSRRAATASSKEPVKTAGSRSAPITMEVFSDFQCPACQQLYFGALKPLMNDYVHTGKVFLVHRDNPLAMHPFARDAARWANAAAQLGKFEKAVEVIYASQSAWAVDKTKLEQALAQVLTPAELNQARASLLSPVIEASIDSDLRLGQRVPVTSTPTVVLTHKGQKLPLPAGVNYPLLRRVLDQMLAGK